MSNYSDKLPPLLMGEELKKSLQVLPAYNKEIINMPAEKRLVKLLELYQLFVPGLSGMAEEIYCKLYMMTTLSLKQKGTIEATKQINMINQWKGNGEFNGIITGASSSSIIGPSGIGKTTSIQKAVKLIGPNIEDNEGGLRKIIPVIIVSCPFDASYKGLLYEILICIDEQLHTNYYEKISKSSYNSQQLLALVVKLCHMHVGVLVIDEIQFLMEHKAGTQLYRMILQLINVSGISVMLVGTPECIPFFEQNPQMSRRSTGLRYENMTYEEFYEFCKKVFYYQYIKERSSLTDGLAMWLYEHTAGNPSCLIALLHDAQEIAIIKGTEKINIQVLTEAYSKRMKMLHSYIEPKKQSYSKIKTTKLQTEPAGYKTVKVEKSYKDIRQESKDRGVNIVSLLKKSLPVEEI